MLPKVSSNDFYFEIAKGNVDGYSALQLVGKNADVDGTEDLWNQGGSLTRVATAALLYISSSDATDVDLEVTIVGVDANYDTITEVITTDGTTGLTPVAGTKLFLRVNSITMTVAPAGNVYVYYTSAVTNGVPDDATKIQGKVAISTTQVFNMIYTVPRDKNLYLTSFSYYSSGSTTTHSVILTIHVKRYGASEIDITKIQYVDPNNGNYSFGTKPIEIPAKADFDIEVALTGGTNMDIVGTADFVIEDIDALPATTDIMTKAEYIAYLAAGGGLTVSSTKLYLIGLDEYPIVPPKTFDLLQLLNAGGVTGTTSFVVATTTDVCFDAMYFTGGLLISTTKPAVLCIWRAVDSGGGVRYVDIGVNNLINLKSMKKVTFVAS